MNGAAFVDVWLCKIAKYMYSDGLKVTHSSISRGTFKSYVSVRGDHLVYVGDLLISPPENTVENIPCLWLL